MIKKTHHLSARRTSVWSRGGLSWKELARELWTRSQEHGLVDRAGLLSYYFLLAFFPLLILLSTLIGFFLTSQTDTYWRLLDYLAHFMPNSAFLMFSNVLQQIKSGASGGKLSFGLILALWTSSSGVAALIEALNIAFDVAISRSWWRRKLVAMGLTLSIGIVFACSLLFIFATSSTGAFVAAKVLILGSLHGVSTHVRSGVDLALLFLSLMLIYAFGPNLHRKRWEGIVPGTLLALFCWLIASWGLRFYLSNFGSLGRSYGSLAGVVALLFWLYASAAAILLGGELNAIIWQATGAENRKTMTNAG